MAHSLFNEPFVFGDKSTSMFYRSKLLSDGRYLVTTDHGSWVILDKKELVLLESETFDADFFKLLDEKGIILTNHNISRILDLYSSRYRFLFDATSLHIIIPTLRCNHKCIYCHSSAACSDALQTDMTEETAQKTLEYIFQTPAKNITIEFQGGDGLLVFDMVKYTVLLAKKMNLSFKKNIHFALVTNLTLMTDEFLAFLIKENVNICTSLDGPKYVHDKNRINEGGGPTHDSVIYWIERIRSMYGKSVSALMVTTRYSLPYAKEIVDEYVSLGISNIQIKYINKLGFADKTWNEIGYSVEEFISFWKTSVDYMIELNKKGIFVFERYVKLILQKILSPRDPSFLDFRSPCGIVCGQQAYNYNGDIYACDEARNFEIFKLGNVGSDKFKDVVKSEKSQALINASLCENYICDLCAYKPWCGLCPVIAYAEQGNIIPKISSFSKCKYFSFMFDYIFTKLSDPDVRPILIKWFSFDIPFLLNSKEKSESADNKISYDDSSLKPVKKEKMLLVVANGIGDFVRSLFYINYLKKKNYDITLVIREDVSFLVNSDDFFEVRKIPVCELDYPNLNFQSVSSNIFFGNFDIVIDLSHYSFFHPGNVLAKNLLCTNYLILDGIFMNQKTSFSPQFDYVLLSYFFNDVPMFDSSGNYIFDDSTSLSFQKSSLVSFDSYLVFFVHSQKDGLYNDKKNWNFLYFAELLKKISIKYSVVLLGSDKKAYSYFQTMCSTSCLNLIGKTTLEEATSILCNAKFFVGVDSGLAQIAQLFAKKGIVLLGPSEPLLVSPNTIIIKGSDGDINTITPNQVLEALNRELLN